MVLGQEGKWRQELLEPAGWFLYIDHCYFRWHRHLFLVLPSLEIWRGESWTIQEVRGAWSGKDGREDVQSENRGGREHSLRHIFSIMACGKGLGTSSPGSDYGAPFNFPFWQLWCGRGPRAWENCEDAEPTPSFTLLLAQLWASVPFRNLLGLNDECLSGVQGVISKPVPTKLQPEGLWLESERSGHEEKQRKDTWQTWGSGRYPKRTKKNRGTLGEIQRKALVSSWLPRATRRRTDAHHCSPSLVSSTYLSFPGDNLTVQMNSKMRYFCFSLLPSCMLLFTPILNFYSLLFSGVILSNETCEHKCTYVILPCPPLSTHMWFECSYARINFPIFATTAYQDPSSRVGVACQVPSVGQAWPSTWHVAVLADGVL